MSEDPKVVAEKYGMLRITKSMMERFKAGVALKLALRAEAMGKMRIFRKGDPRPKPNVNGNGTIFAPRLPTDEDIINKVRPVLYHGAKLKWKAPLLVGMANPHIRKVSRDKYSPYHHYRASLSGK